MLVSNKRKKRGRECRISMKKGIERDESLKQKDNIMSRQRNEIADLKENQAETEKLIQKLKAEAKQHIKEYEK